MSQWDTKTAEWYADNYGEYATNKLGLAAVKLNADSTIVDIGCGTGSTLRHAAEKVTHGSLIGIDPVPRMIEIAKQQTAAHAAVDRFLYFVSGAENLPIEDASADVVLAFDSYDHWQDQPKGLQEVRRVLKPGGRFVVVKDGGLPNGAEVKVAFLSGLADAGFQVIEENNIDKSGVSFTQWLCVECG